MFLCGAKRGIKKRPRNDPMIAYTMVQAIIGSHRGLFFMLSLLILVVTKLSETYKIRQIFDNLEIMPEGTPCLRKWEESASHHHKISVFDLFLAPGP